MSPCSLNGCDTLRCFFPLAVVFAQSAVVSPLEWEVLYPILGKLQTRIELGCGVRANFR